jgi:enoyl-CoA hydratase/carnithine racemase
MRPEQHNSRVAPKEIVMSAQPKFEVMEMQLRREGGIAIMTIHNPSRRNAWSEPVKEDTLRHLASLLGDKSCRAIVIAGSKDIFSAGGDVKGMKDRHNRDTDDYMSRRLHRTSPGNHIIKTLVSCPKPVVTAVEGAAFGIGMGLAVASDYTVAASNARFAAAQIRRGLCPDGYMYYTVTARCGPGRAREILLSGREVSALEAERYGIVHELVEPGKALEAAMVAAERFAAVPPLAFALTKAAMTDSYHTLEACFRAEQDYQPIVGLSRDHKESVAAFLEKRKAEYTGE